MRAFKTSACQRSTQDSYNLPSGSFQRLDREKTTLTEEQMSKTTQQIENIIARKVKDESWRTKNTTLKALGYVSETSLHGDVATMSAETALGEKDGRPDQFGFHGLESQQENIAPETTFTDAHFEAHDRSYFTCSGTFQFYRAFQLKSLKIS